jgi:hypothetical protein
VTAYQRRKKPRSRRIRKCVRCGSLLFDKSSAQFCNRCSTELLYGKPLEPRV